MSGELLFFSPLLRLSQCRTSSYRGIAVIEFFVTLTRPRRFRVRNDNCTADFERPVRLDNSCRLTAMPRSSDRYNAVHNAT